MSGLLKYASSTYRCTSNVGDEQAPNRLIKIYSEKIILLNSCLNTTSIWRNQCTYKQEPYNPKNIFMTKLFQVWNEMNTSVHKNI